MLRFYNKTFLLSRDNIIVQQEWFLCTPDLCGSFFNESVESKSSKIHQPKHGCCSQLKEAHNTAGCSSITTQMTSERHLLKTTIQGFHLGCVVALAYFDDLNVTEPKDITLEEFFFSIQKTMGVAAVLLICFTLIYQCIGS